MSELCLSFCLFHNKDKTNRTYESSVAVWSDALWWMWFMWPSSGLLWTSHVETSSRIEKNVCPCLQMKGNLKVFYLSPLCVLMTRYSFSSNNRDLRIFFFKKLQKYKETNIYFLSKQKVSISKSIHKQFLFIIWSNSLKLSYLLYLLYLL